MRRLARLLLLSLLLGSSGSSAVRAGTQPFVGEIMTVAFNFCPKGFAEMNGQLLPINQNQALFSLLGFTYGGNGTTNFALPNAKSVPTLVNGAPLHQCIAIFGVFPARD